MCEETNEKRRADNKRPRSVGFFRTDVLLYDERSPHESEIEVAFDNDLKRPVDTIIIVGTRLEIDSLRSFVKDMCRSAERTKRDILTIWHPSPLSMPERCLPSTEQAKASVIVSKCAEQQWAGRGCKSVAWFYLFNV
ncbi:uncharacterized protein BDR25DRAFT_316832 [Lindgomyces ingoldianus]|uniref:Uncharacterized protein n=1 Tax=Lindgomyces ingoldianus TaxID=673940 RepID=A0ACB6QKM4_9PLEO|nr:uncharacterized protein BDR25DRAFT_316832 [Lindgomyces ingoldianus]KAF2467493.1 hypothetical protein BDR25DRAFT_316832 [Lindgomyces ingoldianus]